MSSVLKLVHYSIAVNGDKLDCEYRNSSDGKTLKVFNPKERAEMLKELGSELSAKEKEQVGLVAEISFNGDKLVFIFDERQG